MEDIILKIKNAIKLLNEKGIPTPILRDMLSKQPSITYTMLVISFVATVISLFGILGLDFDKCLQLLSYVGIGYVGRKFQKGDLTIEGKGN